MSWTQEIMIERRREGKWALRLLREQQDDGEWTMGEMSDPVPPSDLLSVASDGPFWLEAEAFLDLLDEASVPELSALAEALRTMEGAE